MHTHCARINSLRNSKHLPYLFLQLFCVIFIFYTSIFVCIYFTDWIFDKHFSFSQFFSIKAFDPKVHFIIPMVLSFLASIPLNFLSFWFFVGRAKSVLEFFCSIICIHMIAVLVFSKRLPSIAFLGILFCYFLANVLIIEFILLKIEKRNNYTFGGFLEMSAK